MIEQPAASNDPARLELVDGVRGFALMGLFLVHSVELFELYWVHPVPDPWFDATMAVFAGKAFSLFALCFGLSFSIIMDRTRRRGVDFRGGRRTGRAILTNSRRHVARSGLTGSGLCGG